MEEWLAQYSTQGDPQLIMFIASVLFETPHRELDSVIQDTFAKWVGGGAKGKAVVKLHCIHAKPL